MKNLKYLFLLCFSYSMFSSCNILELAPEDYFGDNNFWKNEAQVSNFMTGIHNQLRNHQFQLFRIGELRGGLFRTTDDFGVAMLEIPLIEQRITENFAGIGSWGGFYPSILQINLFISKIEELEFLSIEQKDLFLGQAYGLRAFYYFHLLRTYGGVPLRITPEVITNQDPVSLRMARNTEDEVLAHIKADIDKSVAFFGSQIVANKGYWNPNATQMLKAEVFLWSAKVYGTTADLNTAKTSLELVTTASLLPDFEKVFAFDNKKNSEVIFAIHSTVNESEVVTTRQFLYDNNNFQGLYNDTLGTTAPDNDPLLIAESNSWRPIQNYAYQYSLYEKYDINDKRRDATFLPFYDLNTSSTPIKVNKRTTVLKKFIGTRLNNKRYYSDDWTIYREADRLLMLAEINNALGQSAKVQIDAIRSRAYGGVIPAGKEFNGAVGDETELAIFEERVKEFVWEGKRWYDLRRMKLNSKPMMFKSVSTYGVLNDDEEYKKLWPIEAAIWTNDPLVVQTPGYATTKP